ncbi:thioesterase II family protein [Puia sp.]|jgi:surfactin synthase thioesterase subunit|uniref:thioesterase II family protein n=1 Tax=Puia sp. TaxID=2045100 RepID=UPI002F413898
MKTIRLFCLPFAGGNKYSYREFEEKMPPFIRPVALEYPGRGARIREPLVASLPDLTDDLFAAIKNKLNEGDYAIFGHSMGGLVALLLARKIAGEGYPPPMHLFITGTTGPFAYAREGRARHKLPKQEFIQEIKELDGSPDEILQNEDLLNYFEPILRSDFKAAETYEYEKSRPLDVPFTVITGTEEDMTEEDILTWQMETTRRVDFRKMKGKHFFIFDHSDTIIGIISQKISQPIIPIS